MRFCACVNTTAVSTASVPASSSSCCLFSSSIRRTANYLGVIRSLSILKTSTTNNKIYIKAGVYVPGIPILDNYFYSCLIWGFPAHIHQLVYIYILLLVVDVFNLPCALMDLTCYYFYSYKLGPSAHRVNSNRITSSQYDL